MRRRTINIGAPQQVHSNCGRGVRTSALTGSLNTSRRNSAIRRLQFGCRKPKLRARRKPLGNTCCMSSHKKAAPLTVRVAIFLGLAAPPGVFGDPAFVLVQASRSNEALEAAIGFDVTGRLLFVVHIEIDGAFIRMISARHAGSEEERQYVV